MASSPSPSLASGLSSKTAKKEVTPWDFASSHSTLKRSAKSSAEFGLVSSTYGPVGGATAALSAAASVEMVEDAVLIASTRSWGMLMPAAWAAASAAMIAVVFVTRVATVVVRVPSTVASSVRVAMIVSCVSMTPASSQRRNCLVI